MNVFEVLLTTSKCLTPSVVGVYENRLQAYQAMRADMRNAIDRVPSLIPQIPQDFLESADDFQCLVNQGTEELSCQVTQQGGSLVHRDTLFYEQDQEVMVWTLLSLSAPTATKPSFKYLSTNNLHNHAC